MLRKYSILAAILVCFLFSNLAASAQTKGVDAEGHAWWQHAVFYEIYPRSYMDSNNDGIGDLNGIASKMDYLQVAGRGCDLDCAVLPVAAGRFRLRRFGLREHRSDVRHAGRLRSHGEDRARRTASSIIFDFVVNHTSDKHKWFLESALVEDQSLSRLVHLARRQRPEPATE